jgi:hypothetical protein
MLHKINNPPFVVPMHREVDVLIIRVLMMTLSPSRWRITIDAESFFTFRAELPFLLVHAEPPRTTRRMQGSCHLALYRLNF